MPQDTARMRDESSIVHSSFSIERTYPADTTRVFHAFSDEATKRRWFVEGEGWEIFESTFDFRTGGREFSRFRFGDGPETTFDAHYMNIVPDRRIIFAYNMTVASKPVSASLVTVELLEAGEGTRLTYTEHDAFLDGADTPKSREEGCRELLEKLAEELESR